MKFLGLLRDFWDTLWEKKSWEFSTKKPKKCIILYLNILQKEERKTQQKNSFAYEKNLKFTFPKKLKSQKSYQKFLKINLWALIRKILLMSWNFQPVICRLVGGALSFLLTVPILSIQFLSSQSRVIKVCLSLKKKEKTREMIIKDCYA